MRSVVLIIIFLIAASSGDSDFNSNVAKFSVELLYRTMQDAGWQSRVMSPYTIWSLLTSMAYENLGDTWEEVSNVFLLTKNRSEFVEAFTNLRQSVFRVNNMVSWNFLFYDENFHIHSDSISRLENNFGFITRRFNFKDQQGATVFRLRILEEHLIPTIGWHGVLSIQDFINSTMIINNFSQFYAEWSNPFTNKLTPVYNGHRNSTGYMTIMSAKGRFRISNFESLKATVTELPYKGREYGMLLIRPHSGHEIQEVFNNLRNISLNDIFAKLQNDGDESGWNEVEVNLPSFSDETRINLNKPLFKMGLSSMFDENSADFNNFSEDDIYISEITHRTSFVVNFNRTYIITTTPTLLPPSKSKRNDWTVVKSNDPFIYLIVVKSTVTLLFGGSYTDTILYQPF
ncbi:serine protease inhibitor 88Ea-like [Maniola jurtina]|uniref:serine protease inhibitor 88Ea-like n=1 Tax=Maniola jurtina TaxID=191418 RepID=UPI001E68D6DF|nr:serine protease inhibitor 88Ea-like [Maniola jurtina]